MSPAERVYKAVTHARVNWPRFAQLEPEVLVQLRLLRPHGTVEMDLRMAYAMAAWSMSRVDWRKAIGV